MSGRPTFKRYSWEPQDKFFWEASLTGDLVCGNCSRMMSIDPGKRPSPGLIPCRACKKKVELKEEIITLADERAKSAFPQGRPRQEDFRWKGD